MTAWAQWISENTDYSFRRKRAGVSVLRWGLPLLRRLLTSRLFFSPPLALYAWGRREETSVMQGTDRG